MTTTIRFDETGAIGNIVLANRPSTVSICSCGGLRVAVHQASESDIRVLVVRAEAAFQLRRRSAGMAGKGVSTGSGRVADGETYLSRHRDAEDTDIAVVQVIAFGGGSELHWRAFFLLRQTMPSSVASITTAMCRSREPYSGCRARRSCAGVTICHACEPIFRT